MSKTDAELLDEIDRAIRETVDMGFSLVEWDVPTIIFRLANELNEQKESDLVSTLLKESRFWKRRARRYMDDLSRIQAGVLETSTLGGPMERAALWHDEKAMWARHHGSTDEAAWHEMCAIAMRRIVGQSVGTSKEGTTMNDEGWAG